MAAAAAAYPERATAPSTQEFPDSQRRFDRRWIALIVTTIGSFMSILDTTIVNVALPNILKSFHADLGNGQLVLMVYLIALAVVVPTSGFLADRVGLKRLYITTMVLFTAGSVLCGLAWNLPSLIVFRLIQGLGGGMLQPLGMATVFTIIKPIERPRFMALLGLPMVIAPLLGPTVGGYIVEYSSWRFIFLLNLPIGIINVVLAVVLLKESAIRKDARFDRAGWSLAVVAFPLLLLGLSRGSVDGWGSPAILGMFAVGATALVTFVRHELRQTDPLLDVRLFREPMFSLAMGLGFVTQFSLFGLQFLLPLFLQTARGLSPGQTGLVLLPAGITSFIAMNVAGRLYNRTGPRPLVISGLSALVVATAIFSRMTENTPVGLIALLASVRGVGAGLCMMPANTTAYNAIREGSMTRATALVNVTIRTYGAATTAILTTILAIALVAHGAPEGASITRGNAPVHFIVAAFSDAFLAMSILAAIGVPCSLFLRDVVVEGLKRERLGRPASEAAGGVDR